MGRFTNVYIPEGLVFVVRSNPVFSSSSETVALGMTPPCGSVTSPVSPPSVCCARREELHSAKAATIASSRTNNEKADRMGYLKLQPRNRDFPSGLLSILRSPWGKQVFYDRGTLEKERDGNRFKCCWLRLLGSDLNHGVKNRIPAAEYFSMKK